MKSKPLISILIILLALNLLNRLIHLSESTGYLWELLSDYVLSGNLFQSHILSHNSTFFWFNFLQQLMPIAVVVFIAVGLFTFIQEKGTQLNRWIIISLILTYYSVIPLVILWGLGLTVVGTSKVFYYDSIFSLIALVLHYLGLLYSTVYFILIKRELKESRDVSDNRKIRLINYTVDMFFILYLSITFKSFFVGEGAFEFLISFWVVSISYYLFCEFLFQQTLGKAFTKTFVIGENSLFATALLRTMLRKIPLESLSFLIRGKNRWHDRFSGSKICRTQDN